MGCPHCSSNEKGWIHEGMWWLQGDSESDIKNWNYPLPKIDDLLASLAGGKKFSKLDLAKAYQQVPIDDKSKKLVAINTHKDLFQYHMLPFGISAAPSIFQCMMETLLQGLSGVCLPGWYSHHSKNRPGAPKQFGSVLQRLHKAGMKLNPDKCYRKWNTCDTKFLRKNFSLQQGKCEPLWMHHNIRMWHNSSHS